MTVQTFDLTAAIARQPNDLQRWASFHDWFVRNEADGVVCREVMVDQSGAIEIEYRFFDNMRDLRDWAGY